MGFCFGGVSLQITHSGFSFTDHALTLHGGGPDRNRINYVVKKITFGYHRFSYDLSVRARIAGAMRAFRRLAFRQ